MQRCAYHDGDRVLDISCGFGDSTVRIARSVAPRGATTGMDCAANFIRDAGSLARSERGQRAILRRRCADGRPAGAVRPCAFARFGTMFFEMPGAAMRNVREALRPGGTFMQIVWRRREENPWLHEAELCVKAIVPAVSREETEQVREDREPFSMSGPDMVSLMLRGAGFERITFERHDCDICIGRDLDDAIEFAMALGPAGELIRLAGAEGEAQATQVAVALKETLAARRSCGAMACGRHRAPGSSPRSIRAEDGSGRVGACRSWGGRERRQAIPAWTCRALRRPTADRQTAAAFS
ncbi:MAG: class I SAM-dependent methyltransferase [Lysobacterales bacterium]